MAENTMYDVPANLLKVMGNIDTGTAGQWCVNSNQKAPAEEGHIIALQVNAEIDRIVSERQFVWICDYDYKTELRRLISIKAFPLRADRQAFYGPDFLGWIRQTALSLWEKGYVPKD
ncbi:hypothetical protein C2478_20635 [Salmonella enterica]|nr:hypothetical protein [Salmonella enterica]ECC4608486.1 hypothetical protein [Salmonella enterica]ECJ1396191.1 hypothetical protein [Salmonella enterica]ECR4999518.1 hypothetical protein [Salmonella enterica]EGH8741948.1 hypothetical protein [Salmonella enterica]